MSRAISSLVTIVLAVAAASGVAAPASPRSAPSPRTMSPSVKTYSYRPYTPSKAATQSKYSSTAQPPRRSLLDGKGDQPSERVREIIHERESSGPGWLGTAFLVSLLSRHDLSESDRSWISGKIGSMRAAGAATGENELLPAVTPAVTFVFTGIEAPLQVGKPATMKVAAFDSKGNKIPVTCDFPGRGAQISISADRFEWTPDFIGSTLLSCEASAHKERRLIRVTG